jgi:cardiolipin synthase C
MTAARPLITLLAALLVACASLPDDVQRLPSHAIAASDDTALGALARRVHAAQPQPHASGFRALPQADFALDARLELVRRAQRTLDVQYYLIGHDAVGRRLLRELDAAAARGVRVRLLVDDYHTLGLDALLLALAAQPNAQVRLFNPFVVGRESAAGRALAMATDFRRLNHRMHNKLLVADGAMAIVGGRNMADEYFQRHSDANFIDFDVLAVGPIVDPLEASFDRHWNSLHAIPVQAIVRADEPAEAPAQAFARGVEGAAVAAPAPADLYGDPALGADLDRGLPNLLWGHAQAYADDPDKVRRTERAPETFATTVTHHSIEAMREARSEIVLVSAYFVPGSAGVSLLAAARRHGVLVSVVTNSMAASDEPLVSVAYQRYRRALLQAGVALYELAPSASAGPAGVQGRRATRQALHAKLAFIDRRTLLLGSMNLDPRSAWTNTELGVRIDSAELAARIGALPAVVAGRGAYRVEQADDGCGLQWTPSEPDLPRWRSEPHMGWLERARLRLKSLFVAEAWL